MRLALLPRGTPADAGVLLTSRAARAFLDGLVSVILPVYLLALGLQGWQVGAIVTATLLGSAAMVLGTGLAAHRIHRAFVLRAAPVLMVATGVGFGLVQWFPGLVVIAIIGTMNPSGGDVSVFLPTEQAMLADTADDRSRTVLFALYSLIAYIVAAIGSLAAGLPELVARHTALSERGALRAVFAVYALGGAGIYALYARLSPPLRSPQGQPAARLGASRRVVYRLAATFSLDSLGGGFVVQSLLALWLFRRFDLSVAVTGQIFFWTGLLSGLSALVAVRIADRIGLIRTMVYTHLPANVFLMATPFMPTVGTAVACLLARSALSQMDAPMRSSYVMAIVTPEERTAAASVTNLPRALAGGLSPLLGGWLLDQSTFGWTLVVGGALKAAYDLLLLVGFRHVRPPEEQ